MPYRPSPSNPRNDLTVRQTYNCGGGGPPPQLTLLRFADGEIFVKIDENVRGRDVYIIQPTTPPAENMMELLLLMDAAKRASAARVTAGIPYFGCARQDRKEQARGASRGH